MSEVAQLTRDIHTAPPGLAWAFRPYSRETDEALVFATWINTYRESSGFGRSMKPHTFSIGHHDAIERIMGWPGVNILMACAPDMPGQVFGYICYEAREQETIVHYLWVKGWPVRFQRHGVASALLACAAPGEQPTVIASHWTDMAERIVKHRPHLVAKYSLIYSPYFAFYQDAKVKR